MERDVAFHLLNDLVDMTIEDAHGTKTLEVSQSLLAVVGPPTPLGINRPKRDMGKKDDGRAVGAALQIIFQPFQLVVSENAKSAFFDIHDVNQPHEMHALLVETVPTRPLGSFAETFTILLPIIIDDVMFPRHVKHLTG